MKSMNSNAFSIKGKVVRIAGLEPAHLSALPPQSSVSANSTICASESKILPDQAAEASFFNGPAASSNRASGRAAGI